MNLLEHNIIKVEDIKYFTEEYVDMPHMPGFENDSNYLLEKRWSVTYEVNCYGQKSNYTKVYYSYDEFISDLKQGYFMA